ncbi:MAG: three-Cys-motif partner protein TcmP [Pirellulales bacterium]|nr:three-Cys-motif partner protein TcmP [Pirellulales bacterium]
MGRARDLWLELCEKYENPDGLPTWEEAGKWTEDKLYFWKKYLDITTAAMTGHRAFPGGLVYLDLFGGAGICMLKGSKRRFPGSAIIAAHAIKPFQKIIVCEKDPTLSDACNTRLERSGTQSLIEVFSGDCNLLIDRIIASIPDRTLTLTFVDPKGLDAQFRTIEKIAQRKRADFVVLFADAYDIIRNFKHVYWTDPKSKLDQVLGESSNWREEFKNLDNPDAVNIRKMFAEIYKKQMKRLLGYLHFEEKVICRRSQPLYRLIYASRSDLGLKFWREAVKQDSSGQRDLF